MFTGLVEAFVTVRRVERSGRHLHLAVTRPAADLDWTVREGDSIALNGVCLTVERHSRELLHFTAAEETVRTTTLAHVTASDRLNAERALRADSRLGGHFVTGHVDGTGRIVSDTPRGASLVRQFEVSPHLAPLIAAKGSVAVDGVSLTVAARSGPRFSVSLVPYTLSHTNIMTVRPGDRVNIECDILAKYVASLQSAGDTAATGAVSDTPAAGGADVAPDTASSLISRMEHMGY